MREVPKAQVGAVRQAFDPTVAIVFIIALAVVGSISQVKQCMIGEDVARAKCITAGGDEHKCCKAFGSGSCMYLEHAD